MTGDNLFYIVADVDPTDVDGAVDTGEAADTAHVVAVVGELVAAEAVDVGVEEVVDVGEAVQVLTVLAAGADAAGEEEAEVGAGDLVGAREPTVSRDVAPPLGRRLGQVLVLPIAPRPLVVPYVEDGARLRRRL